jgi:hypothetical protein
MHNKFSTFRSRYAQQRVVTQINENQYTLEGPSHFVRASGNPDTIEYFDFEGGPDVWLGMAISFLEIKDDARKITKIEQVMSEEENYGKVLLTVA